jgi:formylglycine-generating enzyme required for sulfatase activity
MPRAFRPWLSVLALASTIGSVALPASAVNIEWVTIGNPGNAADLPVTNCWTAGCGSVAYAYRISKYEVTNEQYVEFLNAKAAADPLSLYNTSMDSDAQGGIVRSGLSGSYSYEVKAGFADKPVNFVSFFDAARFTNWLSNGQGSGSTETGTYTLLGASTFPSNWTTFTRNAGATVFLPSEHEWYKAAYYDGATGAYFDYPAGANAQTACAAPGATSNTGNCVSAGVTDVGAYTGSPSPYGTFDQGGNVYEWYEQIVGGTLRGARGGSWNFFNNSSSASFAAGMRSSTGPGGGRNDLGFRVAAAIPEPGSALLLFTGLAGLVA